MSNSEDRSSSAQDDHRSRISSATPGPHVPRNPQVLNDDPATSAIESATSEISSIISSVTSSVVPSSTSATPLSSRRELTSVITLSTTASNGTPSIQTVTLTSILQPSASTSAPVQDSGLSSSAKIALGVSIPLGVILIAALVIGGFILGRRSSASKGTKMNIGWHGLWRGRRAKEPLEGANVLCLSASQEKHELPAPGPAQELPTGHNAHEMAEERKPVELPQRSPVELA